MNTDSFRRLRQEVASVPTRLYAVVLIAGAAPEFSDEEFCQLLDLKEELSEVEGSTHAASTKLRRSSPEREGKCLLHLNR